jgi:hypothetical protein
VLTAGVREISHPSGNARAPNGDSPFASRGGL